MILAGDVGGTNARLAIFAPQAGVPHALFEQRYACDGFANFLALLAYFLEEARAALGPLALARGCLGVAGPREPGRVRLSNRPWTVRAAEVASLTGAQTLLLNDFEAAAHGVELLQPSELGCLQEGTRQGRAPQLVIGAGTGLGIAYRVWCGERYGVVTGEGGHAGFAPATEEQAALASWLMRRDGRASAEHVVSGSGLTRIHAFLCAGVAAAGHGELAPEVICARAFDGSDPVALRALDLFVACYGAAAGDHALAVGAAGGVYVAGGIVQRILPRLAAGGFISSFNAKGAHERLTRAFPVHAVLTDRLGLLGAAGFALEGDAA
jgi:glucokinase